MNPEYTFQETKFQSRQGININDLIYMENFESPFSHFVFTFLKDFFFWCGPFLKSSLNSLQYCFCFMFWIFGCKACEILVPWPEIKPTLPIGEPNLYRWITRAVFSTKRWPWLSYDGLGSYCNVWGRVFLDWRTPKWCCVLLSCAHFHTFLPQF